LIVVGWTVDCWAQPPPRGPAERIGPAIDAQIAEGGDFSGAVLVVARGKVIYQKATGVADREQGAPNAPDTQFGIASMGKMFTAVAVMQLAEAGKLELDAPVGSYLKDYANADFARTVTIRQLLTHTGGAGDFMGPLWAARRDQLRTPADYVALFGARPPEFSPGSRFSYANYGYVVLGRIVEVASGQAYGDYLQDHVFQPAGMTRTSLQPGAGRGLPWAHSYVTGPQGVTQRPKVFDGATPAGGAYSTVGDLQLFARALIDGRLLDAAHLKLATTGVVRGEGDLAGHLFGLGFEDWTADGHRDVGHNGGGPGQNGALHILEGGELVVVVLSNVAPPWRGDKLAAFVAARVR
jgi:CubicO group peptidase (beta-lactamase class C family)